MYIAVGVIQKCEEAVPKLPSYIVGIPIPVTSGNIEWVVSNQVVLQAGYTELDSSHESIIEHVTSTDSN